MSGESIYRITGGHALEGTVRVSGAKNAITKQLVASVLTDEPCYFRNVPEISEIRVVLDMLRQIGTECDWLDRDTLRVRTPRVDSPAVSLTYSGSNRIPILLLGPLMHRTGEARVPTVGGCQIGARPVDFHMDGLKQMGAEVQVLEDQVVATSRRLQGAQITLPFPSVGATEDLVMAASLANGRTVIHHAAIEPEIIDTILFLQKMGAHITVEVDRRIIIEGVNKLHGARHTAIPDRMEVASFASAAVATDGCVRIENARQEHMISFLNHLRKAGGHFEADDTGITFRRVARGEKLKAINLQTDVHPGFMTDWQPPFAVLLTQAEGASVIHETVMSNRFGYTRALREMGAKIQLHIECLGSRECRYRDLNHLHSCVIMGPTPLTGKLLEIPDLRAGFAYIIAALVAHEGISEIRGIEYLERGYANVPARLRDLGADFEELPVDSITEAES